MRPALLVDTYSLFFRAHHALPPMNTQSGRPTSALYGFCTALLKELRERRPSALAFAVDAPFATFRHQAYAGYKAQRERAPDALVQQFGPLRELLAAFGVPVFEVRGFEADDVLCTLGNELRQAQVAALVLSGDRDLLQLAHGGVQVLFLGARGQPAQIYDAAAVQARFSVASQQLPSWAALVGDPSDNLPGTPGVGARTAAKWVQTYGSVDNLLAHLAELTPVRLRPVIEAHAEQLRLNEQLSTLRVDVPLGPGPHVAPLLPEGIENLRREFRQLEFKSLEARLDALLEHANRA
ncbi:MAG: 5'-3' exonuclease H3TH domain-containing protein [Deltaproteobacteria bacterium]